VDQIQKPKESEKKKEELTFIDAKVVVSRDQKQIIHILPDGRAIGKPLAYYASIIQRVKM
jgi:hypothetical protein